MSEPEGLLGAEQVHGLLLELGRRLHARGVEGQLFLVGGAAMALAFSRRRLTRDLDAVFEPKTAIYEEAAAMARERGLADDWLNDGVKGLLPDRSGPVEAATSFSAQGIHVGIASADYLFAMKAQAARPDVDADDLKFLAKHLGLRSATDAMNLVQRFYGPTRILPKTQFVLQELMSDLAEGAAVDRAARTRRSSGKRPGSGLAPSADG